MGLDIGVRALKAQRRALDVTGHNIANANTEGYSRQRAELTTTNPYTLPSLKGKTQAGQVGTGVKVKEINRLRNLFLDKRFRQENSYLGEWEQRSTALSEVEMILGEPSDLGLRSAMDEFWNSLQELHNNPESAAVRSAVRQSAASMNDVFKNLNNQLEDFKWALDGKIQDKVNNINSYAQRIADLNEQISQISSNGDNPNDLMDKRDLLIDKLSTMVNVQVKYDQQNKAKVSIGGFSLVDGKNVSKLKAVQDNLKDGLVEVRWESTGNEVKLKTGELKGLIDSRDEIVTDHISKLNEMAGNLINEFNNLHKGGFGLDGNTGRDFFTGTDASDIGLSAAIEDEINGLNKIAAASTATGTPGDGTNALDLSKVMKGEILTGNKTTMIDFWGGMVSQLGINSQRAQHMTKNQEALTQQIDQHRQSVSGVSLDEEMANMIKFQHAYNAAAKLIKTQDELLNTLVNGILR